MSLRETANPPSTKCHAEQLPSQKPTPYAAHACVQLRAQEAHPSPNLWTVVDLAAMESMPADRLKQEIALLVERLLGEDSVAINDSERSTLVRDIQHEMLGLGPLEVLMADPTISDILVNTYGQVFVERRGKLEPTEVSFSDDQHLMRIIDKIVSPRGAAHRRVQPDGGCTIAGRLAGQRDHPAGRDRWTDAVDSALRCGAAHHGGSGQRAQDIDREHGAAAREPDPGQGEHA